MPQNATVVINAKITISGTTLHKIVQMAKSLKGPDAKGHFHLDTADVVSDLISQFIAEEDFEAYVADRRHYEALLSDAEG